MLDPDGDTQLYLQITDIIRRRISDLTPGMQVPSESDIQHEFGVARTTARRALRVLRGEGLIRDQVASGRRRTKRAPVEWSAAYN